LAWRMSVAFADFWYFCSHHVMVFSRSRSPMYTCQSDLPNGASTVTKWGQRGQRVQRRDCLAGSTPDGRGYVVW
jgi:hypothetical protein